jgi:hypothetical protein
MVFDVNASTITHLEKDNYRATQIEYLIGKLFGDELLSELE